MRLWVPVATAAMAAAVTICGYILTRRRKHAKAKRETAAKFRSALAEAITQAKNIDAHFLITEARIQHDAAISGFQSLVDLEQIKRFNAAVQKFHRARSGVQPARLKVLASLNSGKPVDYSDTYKLKEALNELLAFADNT